MVRKMQTNSWYRFCMQVFVQIQVCQCLFGDAGPTPHSNIQAGDEPMWYTTLSNDLLQVSHAESRKFSG